MPIFGFLLHGRHLIVSNFCCFVFVDWANMKTLRNRPVDYGCRYFGEMCYFLFSLLSKVYAISSLPMSEAWELYVGEPDEPFVELPDSEILSDNRRITDAIALTPSSAVRTFPADAKKFLKALIASVRTSICATSDLGRSLSCFCPDILLQGDDLWIFDAFGKLVGCLRKAGRLSDVQAIDAQNEFKSFVVAVRAKHKRVDPGTIQDVFKFILGCDAINSRGALRNVVKQAALILHVVVPPAPVISCNIPPGGSPKVLRSALICVQSFALTENFSARSLFSTSCIADLRESISHADAFIQNSNFSPWTKYYRLVHSTVLSELTESYSAVIGSRTLVRRKEMEESADSRRDPLAVRNILDSRRDGGSRATPGARASAEAGVSSVHPFSKSTVSKGPRLSDVGLNLGSPGKKGVKKAKKVKKTTIVSSSYSVIASGSVTPVVPSAPVVATASAAVVPGVGSSLSAALNTASVSSPNVQPSGGDVSDDPISVVAISSTATSQAGDPSPGTSRPVKKAPSSSASSVKRVRRSFDDKDEDWVPETSEKKRKSAKFSKTSQS